MRKLPPLLKKYFDKKVPTNPMSPEALLLETAYSCVGVTEIGGDNKGPLVELFQSSVSLPMDQPWCLDFIQACIAYVESSMSIESKLSDTQGVVDLWEKSRNYNGVAYPKPGDIILWRIPGTNKGHCGIITGSDNRFWFTIEGNTTSGMGIDRDGDGVYSKRRQKGGLENFEEIGFLRVFDGVTA